MELPVLSRRNFLKATAVTGMTAALGGAPGLKQTDTVKAESTSETKVIRTCCRACIAKCGVLAHVKNGRVIKLEGDPEQPMTKGAMCAKGLSGIQALYHPNRNKYPMKRVGARGENKWQRISWDEALDTIAEKLMETRDKYGAETVFGTTGGGGNPEFFSIFRFMNVFGSPNVFEPGAAQCYMPRTLANKLMYGHDNLLTTNSIADSAAYEIYMEDTPMKTLVMWGTAPAFNSPAQGGRAVVELRSKGVKTVVIDPRYTADAAKADVWLPIRPGTDVALMLCWVRYIIEHKLYNEEFVLKWTNLPFLVNPKTKLCLRESDIKDGGNPDTYMVWDQKTQSAKPLPFPWDDNLDPALEGTYTVNDMECRTGFQFLKERAEEYTLEKAAEICWLDADMIEKGIKLYAENTPSGISHGVATDQNPNSVQAAMGALTIDFIMGNVENPGNILQNFKEIGIPDLSVTPLFGFLPEEQFKKRFGGNEYKGMLNWGICHHPTLLEAINTEKPYKPRVWMERSGNKLAMLANAKSWAEAIEKLDFIVHAYMYPTSFSMYADILIPTAEWLETDLILPSLNKACVRQAVTHTWETMNETVFWSKLAKRLADMGHEGCKNAFDPEKTFPEPPYWDTYEELADFHLKNSLGMTFAEYKEKAPIEVYSMNEFRTYRTYESTDPKTGKPKGFPTPSKKLEAFGEPFILLGRTGAPFAIYPMEPRSEDYDPLPYFMEPAESPLDEEISKEYPLVMTNGRLPYYHHGTLRNIPWLREIYPVPELWIHPTAAKKYGVSNEDWVWVESKRGKIQARAWVTEGINPGVVYMERFWNPETLGTETNGWQEMNVNILSKNDAPYNDMVGTTTLRGYQVKVSKADGPPKGIWYKPEQFKPWLPEPSDPTKQVEV